MGARSEGEPPEPALRELIEALTAATLATEAYRRWRARTGAASREATAALEILQSATARIEASAHLLLARPEA